MELPGKVLRDFATVVAEASSERSKKGETAFGTVVVENNEFFVRLDGSEELTPVAKAMDAIAGDRVVVAVRNHMAVITGNITSPASARTASSYMKLTEDGLAVGELDEDGDPTGLYSLIGSGAYRVVDEEGNTVALFSPSLIKLGDETDAEIAMCNNKGRIKIIDGVLLLTGEDAVGTRSTYQANNIDYISDIVCRANSTTPATALRSYLVGGDSSNVTVTPTRVDLNSSTLGNVFANNYEVLTTSSLMISGIVRITANISGNSYRTFSYDINSDPNNPNVIPSGYWLAGISEITTDHKKICHLTEFSTNPSNNTISVTFCNESPNTQILKIRIEWFALYSNQNSYVANADISLPDIPPPVDEL